MKTAPSIPADIRVKPRLQVDKPALLRAVILLLLVLVSFAPAFRAQFIWDDDVHVTQNLHLRSLDGLYQIWFNLHAFHQYYPLAQTTWWLEYHLWGDSPAGYHLDNILLHAANALLLWQLLKRLRILPDNAAFWAAALFAIHPMQVETVAWIMERKNLLSSFFYLLAFHAFARHLQLDEAASTRPISPWAYPLGVLFFLAAMFAKSVAASLPAAVLLVCWYKRGAIRRRDWLSMLALFPLSILGGALTGYLERVAVGANGPDWNFSLLDRLLIAGRALWHYLATLAFPYPLMFFYPRWTIDSSDPWQFLFPLAFVALLLALLLLWWFNRLPRGPLACMLFFLGTLVPALGFVNVYPMRYSFVADHFQYMACIGPLLLVAGIASRLAAAPHWRTIVHATLALAAAVLVLLTFQRSTIFYNGLTLYSDLVSKNPAGWAGHNLLACEFMDQRNFPRAVEHFSAATQACAAEPDNWEGLGNALVYSGQPDKALPILQQVVKQRPDSAKAHNDLAVAYFMLKQPQQAATLYASAIQLDPFFAPAHYNLGGMLAHIGQFAAAEREFRTAVAAWSSGDAGGGKTGEGEGLADAVFKLALCLAEQNRLPEALPYFEQAVSLRPDWPEAQQDLARARLALGR